MMRQELLRIMFLILTFGSLSLAQASDVNSDEVRLPRRIECINVDGETFQLNTRAEKINDWNLIPDGAEQADLVLLDSTLEPMIEQDEVFSKGDYYSLTLNQKILRAAAWTCDSADYVLRFNTEDLVNVARNSDFGLEMESVKWVQGKLTRELRGIQQLKTEEISCQAIY